MSKRAKILGSMRPDLGLASPFSAIRIPRPDNRDELSYTAQCLDNLRPLLPLLGCGSLTAVMVLGWQNWHLLKSESIGWLAVGIFISLSLIVSAWLVAKRSAANPVTSTRNVIIVALVGGALWGSADGILPNHLDINVALACLLLGLLGFSALPSAQAAFLFSFAASAFLLGFDPIPADAIVFAAILGVIPIWLTAHARFGRVRARMAQKQNRFAHMAGDENSFTWQSNDEGIISGHNDFLPIEKRSMNHASDPIPLWELGNHQTRLTRRQRSDNGLAADVLEHSHAVQVSFSDVTIHVRKEGRIHRCSLSGQPVYTPSGEFSGFIGVGLDLTARNDVQLRALKNAGRDPLTGVLNRSSFQEALKEKLDQLGRKDGELSVLMVDLDRFKPVNDAFGHGLGDKLLRAVADRLCSFVNSDGLVGRFGGDEFAIMLNDAGSKVQLNSLVSELISQLSLPYDIERRKICVGACAGIAIAPVHGDTVEDLIHNADLALYSAKLREGTQHQFFEPSLRINAEERRSKQVALVNALEHEDIAVQFQPIVDAESARLSGFEALARWEQPGEGAVPPEEFIAIAEAAGLIETLGESVLRKACAAATTWPSHLKVAVNVSPIQLRNPGFASVVSRHLGQSGLSPERLELEITEKTFLEDSETISRNFTDLHELGVKWVLDDFGSGYSSLYFLIKAPLSKIKIDKQFVKGVSDTQTEKHKIIRMIVMLANDLGMKTTAEGVESHSDHRFVKHLGCNEVQGFVYGRALSASDAQSLAKQLSPLESHGFESTRREDRKTVLRSASVFCQDQEESAKVRNISDSGAMLEINWEAEPGTQIEIEMDYEPRRSAVIRWIKNNKMGIEFTDKIPNSEFCNKANVPTQLRGTGKLRLTDGRHC